MFTKRPQTLSNDVFVNLLDIGTVLKPISEAGESFEGRDRQSGTVEWTARRAHIIAGYDLRSVLTKRCR